jgi:hypothetical protein
MGYDMTLCLCGFWMSRLWVRGLGLVRNGVFGEMLVWDEGRYQELRRLQERSMHTHCVLAIIVLMLHERRRKAFVQGDSCPFNNLKLEELPSLLKELLACLK